ncbi:MAG: MCP four helix bundle domain-containing protein [Sulfurisoma sp.]|nr:MCP four helix bundle domain-containing protein [Sulfurisoma sp.]
MTSPMQRLIAFLERLRLDTKLLLGIGGGFVLALLVGLLGFHSVSILGDAVRQAYTVDMMAVSHVLEAEGNLVRMGRSLRQIAMTATEAERAAARKALDEAHAGVRREIEAARPLLARDVAGARLDDFDTAFAAYAKNVEHAQDLLAKADAYADAEAIGFIVSAEFQKVVDRADTALNEVARIKKAGAARAAEENAALAAKTQLWAIGFLLFGLASSIAAGWLITQSIRRPLNALRASIEDLAAGRLDIAVPHTGLANEIGAMAKSLCVLQQGAQVTASQLAAKSFLADLAYRLQHVDSREEFGQQVLSLLADRLGCRQGLLTAIVSASATDLDVVARYGAPAQGQRCDRYTFDDGLIGQCARERKPLLVGVPADPDWRIRSGLGHAAPVEVRVLPLEYGGELVGVLELGFTEALASGGEALLEQVLTIIALPLHGWRTGASKQRMHGSTS